MKSNIFLIAEIGQAHDGSLGILHSYIDALADTGINAIKFQIHIAEAESSLEEPFRVNFSYEDKTRFDYWKRMSFTKDQWQNIKKHCEEVGLEFIASPFSMAAVDLLESLDVKRYKIGSGETSNFLMLERIGKTGKPIILSSGMSSFDEIKSAVDILLPFKNDVSVLQCTTSYPTTSENIGMNVIGELQKMFPNNNIGFSDHSGEIYAGIAAVALGSKILEFHTVFDKRMFGPDAKSSLTINQVSELVKGVRFLENANKNPVDKSVSSSFSDLKNIFEKSLAVNKNLSVGHIITVEDLESKKPSGLGVSAKDYQSILGKKLKTDKKQYDFLTDNDIA